MPFAEAVMSRVGSAVGDAAVRGVTAVMPELVPVASSAGLIETESLALEVKRLMHQRERMETDGYLGLKLGACAVAALLTFGMLSDLGRSRVIRD